MATLSFSLSLLILYLLTLSFQFHYLKVKDPLWIKPYIIVYRNGTVLRDTISDPPSFVNPPKTSQVQSKDIIVTVSSSSTGTRRLGARVFRPARPDPNRKLPILVYFHGGAFCIGSPFSEPDTVYLTRVVAESDVIALSLRYTLFPDDVIPSPYDDSWAFLEWVVGSGPGSDPWVARYGDRSRVFVGGESAGGNIAHHMAIRAGLPGSAVRLTGAFLAMPYFLGSTRVPMEPENITISPSYLVWPYICPGCKAGVDDPFINPGGPGAPRLDGLGCQRLLVYGAELDEMYGRDLWYYKRVKKSGWAGHARFIEAKGKPHVFHIDEPNDPATKKFILDLSEFLNA